MSGRGAAEGVPETLGSSLPKSTMPPRKASTATDAEPPRRSSRISAQPKEEVKEKSASSTKKRNADADTEEVKGDESSASKKKVRSLYYMQ